MPSRHSMLLAAAALLIPPAPLQAQQVMAPAVAADSARAASEAAFAAYEQQTRAGLEQAVHQFLRAARFHAVAGQHAEEREALSNAGLLYNRLGETDSAFVVLRRVLSGAQAAGDLEQEAGVLRQLGEVHHGLGRADSALAFYRAGTRVAAQLTSKAELATGLSNLGIAHRDLGRPDSAQHYLVRAISLRRELNDTLGIAVTLNNLAAVEETLGRPPAAIEYLREALLLRRALGDPGGEGNVLNNIGYNLELLGQPDSALHYYLTALPLLQTSGRQRVIGITLANIGRAYLALGASDSAVSTLRRALALTREEGDRAGEAWALNGLARAHQAARPDSALYYFDEALRALREIGDRAREGATLFHMARFHHRARREPDLARAVAYYDSAASIRASVGARAGGDANRIAFIEQDAMLFTEWALAWLARAPEIGADAAAAAALAAGERGRAQALLDLMRADTSAVRDQWPSTSLVAEGQGLARAAARSGAATLLYMLTQDSLVAWLITSDGHLRVGRAPAGRDSVAALVGEWRAGAGAAAETRSLAGLENADRGLGIRRRTSISPAAAAAALWPLLLPSDLRSHLPRSGELVIVPHGPTALLPFGVLAPDSTATPLGARLALRYAPSIATMLAAEQRASHAPAHLVQGSALIVGNPAMPVVALENGDAVALAPLPGAQREAEWLAAQLGGAALTGAAASEPAVLGRMGSAMLIHFATHGFAFSSESRARESFVALAPSAQDDGRLTVAEVLDSAPALQAELVVLSACQTALGDLKQSEGTVGLQRAFLARGARSVLVSLWNVSDEATEALMRAFYSHWLEDADSPSKAEALRRAQQDVARMPRFEDARYWAAFQLVGAG